MADDLTQETQLDRIERKLNEILSIKPIIEGAMSQFADSPIFKMLGGKRK